MKEQRHRFLCAVCALALVLTAVLAPAAWAAEGTDEAQAEAKTTLTAADAAQMQQADAAVTALTDSEEYEQMSREQRRAAALDELDGLARKGLVRRSSIRTDEENGIVSFTYSCGVLGGILFTPADELEEMTLDAGENGLRPPRGLAEASPCAEMPLTEDVREAAAARQNARQSDENALPDTIGRAAIYYAFDNTVNSSRFPYYSYMQEIGRAHV